MQFKKYYAVYLRLSKEDLNQEESNSIANQRKLIYDYIQTKLNIPKSDIMEFVDDGYSGANFERPAMKKMLEMIRQRGISCVIVKDLSRFGRDYVTAGEYLEHVFPFLKVRFIAVNDGLDSNEYVNNIPGLEVSYKNLFNEFYSTLLSNNVKRSLYQKWESGECISGAPYGYMKKAGEGNRLFINPVTSVIVKEVFSLTLQEKSKKEIARIMNQRGILTPGDYRKDVAGRLKNHQPVHFWTADTVANILKNEEYTGLALAGQYRRPEVGKAYALKIPKEEWKRYENAHPVLVSKVDYRQAMAMNSISPFQRKREENKSSLFTGFLACGYCGHNMQRRIRMNKSPSYYCKYNNNGAKIFCSGKSYCEDNIEKVVFIVIMSQIQLLLEANDLMEQTKQKNKKAILSYHQQRKEYKQIIEKSKTKKLSLYRRLKEGNIQEKQYFIERDILSDKIAEATRRLEKMEKELETNAEQDKQQAFIEQFVKFKGTNRLTREMLEVFIEKIYIWDMQHIKIKLLYEDQMSEIAEMVMEIGGDIIGLNLKMENIQIVQNSTKV